MMTRSFDNIRNTLSILRCPPTLLLCIVTMMMICSENGSSSSSFWFVRGYQLQYQSRSSGFYTTSTTTREQAVIVRSKATTKLLSSTKSIWRVDDECNNNNNNNNRRRIVTSGSLFGIAMMGIFKSSSYALDTPPGVIRSEPCIQGEGNGCNDLSGNNEYIKMLQERSSTNREKNEKEALNAFYMKNYVDYFATLNKVMIKKMDGTYMLVTEQEYDTLLKQNKLILEIPTSRGGKMMDMTQKPIQVLKE